LLTTTNYAASHCAVYSISGYYCPLRYKYPPQHPICKHLQTMALGARVVFTPYKQTVVYSDVYASNYETGRQMILNSW